MNVVYALSDSGGVIRYVGRTSIGAARRLSAHLSRARNANVKSPVAQWIIQIGEERVRIHILEDLGAEATIHDLNTRECYWIETQGTHISKGGLNLTAGGQGNMAGYSHTEETKQKIAQGQLGRKASEELRKKLSDAHLGKSTGPRDPATKAKIANTLTGHTVSETTRAILSEKMRGREITEEHRKSNGRAAHVRWHINKDVVSVECEWC